MGALRPWKLTGDRREIEFEVLGIAKPKGSPVAVATKTGRAFVTERNPNRAWQAEVRDGATAAVGTEGPMEGPLWCRLVFYLPRPKSAPKRFRTVPEGRPDIDKLTRAGLDGLIGVAIRDDSQICALEVAKVHSDRPRVAVCIRALMAMDLEWVGAGEEP